MTNNNSPRSSPAYDRWLTQDPEDDLPPWIYELEDCPKCGSVDPESIPSHAELPDGTPLWDGGVCTCDEEEEE